MTRLVTPLYCEYSIKADAQQTAIEAAYKELPKANEWLGLRGGCQINAAVDLLLQIKTLIVLREFCWNIAGSEQEIDKQGDKLSSLISVLLPGVQSRIENWSNQFACEASAFTSK